MDWGAKPWYLLEYHVVLLYLLVEFAPPRKPICVIFRVQESSPDLQRAFQHLAGSMALEGAQK
ncbi:unnamed protein product [Clonostachys rosea]|uniref:Uncharacterized protein n=1 Tax=Bionectria ochroleuca TaxID=29856 RepID=A0ABY6UVP3_BIOOC|nr:unnamed protein product [Clonostachys rosea]